MSKITDDGLTRSGTGWFDIVKGVGYFKTGTVKSDSFCCLRDIM